jgi:hypothetical protein
MKVRTALTVATLGFLIAVLQLVGVLAGLTVACVVAAALGFSFVFLTRVFDLDVKRRWPLVLVPSIACLLAVSITVVARGTDTLVFVAPVIAAVCCAAVLWMQRSRARRCELCNGRLGRGVAFTCPRCGLLVCEQKCWDFDLTRCRLCAENKVPIFPPERKWWDQRFSARLSQGRCQICMATAEDSDLRACRNCGRPQCRECWDFSNGRCSRCGYVAQDIPESLRALLVDAIPPQPAERPKRRSAYR